jgi:predicted ATP-grasp superfamily ATP-dependent carboligase
LLSIVVAPQARVKGLATDLTQAGFAECPKKGIEKVKVLVGVDNTPANKLYLKCGFEMVAEINNHGILSNIYVAQTAAGEEEKSRIEAYHVVARVNPPVFITYSWCRSSYATVLSLGQRGIDVHIGDAAPLAMSRFSRYCKSFTRLPEFFIEPERYFHETCQALKRTKAKVLLPGHEDVGIFSKRRKDLPADVRVALPEWDSYSIAEDKFAILDLAHKTGCPVPETIEIASLKQLEGLSKSTDWPVVIKARIGNSAKGVRIASDKTELLEKYEELFQTYNLPKDRWPVVQEFLPGEAVGVCLAYDRGRCIASFAERYLRCKEPGKFGTSTLRETFDNEQLISQAIAVMNELKWHGVVHLDFVADKQGRFKLIEINPRLWGALALALFSGIDFPYLWYLTAIEKCNGDLVASQIKKIRCRWIVGDCLAFAELVKGGRFLEALKLMVPQRNCYHDDFTLRDPLPLSLEICDYFTKFIKAGGSVNPVTENMIR